MRAVEFYDAFHAGWTEGLPSSPMKRLASPTLKWKMQTAAGALTFAFATNPKTAGLLPHLPGEFRLGVTWDHKQSAGRKTEVVAWQQYTNDDEKRSYAALQRRALEKFLAQPGKEGLRSVFNYSNDPTWLPRANHDEFAYYLDVTDASAWGKWYAELLPLWVERFSNAPESFSAWCWRVLWPDAERSRS